MKNLFEFAAAALIAAYSSNAIAVPLVIIEQSYNDNYFDVFYTPETGTEFTAWDLIVTPLGGSLLDPNTAQRSFNTSTGNVPLDTFANTVFSSVGAGQANHFFTAYNPGSAFPPVPAQTPPAAGGNPSQLFWTMFDTATGDGPIQGFTPYHMARVMFSAGGYGNVQVRFFNNVDGDIPYVRNYFYVTPEPTSSALASVGLIGLAFRRRMA